MEASTCMYVLVISLFTWWKPVPVCMYLWSVCLPDGSQYLYVCTCGKFVYLVEASTCMYVCMYVCTCGKFVYLVEASTCMYVLVVSLFT